MVVDIPFTIEYGSNTEGIFQAMSQVILKVGEIKILKGDIEKIQQEMKIKDEKMAQFQKENQSLKERVEKLKTRLKGKGILYGANHVI
jgi:FtsZ-binding cell division protein ZapB